MTNTMCFALYSNFCAETIRIDYITPEIVRSFVLPAYVSLEVQVHVVLSKVQSMSRMFK